MPSYKSRKSQSYKKSKNSKNSKNGGRRRKHTMRKYRRGKKVMRGGENLITYRDLADRISQKTLNFGGEFEFIFNKPWNDYLQEEGATEDTQVDIDILRTKPNWNTWKNFNDTFFPST